MREELFNRFNSNTSCRLILSFDANGWYVECYDAFTYDFCWCLKYENYSDALNCFNFESSRCPYAR